jgi:hypothetical protein
MAGLSEDHRASIEAALPDGITMTPEAWADLTEIVVGYHFFEQRRTCHWPRAIARTTLVFG